MHDTSLCYLIQPIVAGRRSPSRGIGASGSKVLGSLVSVLLAVFVVLGAMLLGVDATLLASGAPQTPGPEPMVDAGCATGDLLEDSLVFLLFSRVPNIICKHTAQQQLPFGVLDV
jgi:hypothetical protein